MTTANQHWPDLQEQLERGQLALSIGAGLLQEVTGLPSRTDLARRRAEVRAVLWGNIFLPE